MKNKAETYLRSLTKILPRWSGTDVGHTAGRDWFTALALATIVGVTLIGSGVYRFMVATKSVTEDVATLPIRGLPTSEDDILKTEALFVARAVEFKDFSERVPVAPDPGQEVAPVETTGTDESVENDALEE